MVNFNTFYKAMNGRKFKVKSTNKQNELDVKTIDIKGIIIPLKKRTFINQLGIIEGYDGTLLTDADLEDGRKLQLIDEANNKVYSMRLEYAKNDVGNNKIFNNTRHNSYQLKEVASW